MSILGGIYVNARIVRYLSVIIPIGFYANFQYRLDVGDAELSRDTKHSALPPLVGTYDVPHERQWKTPRSKVDGRAIINSTF